MWKERGLIRIKGVRFKKQTNHQNNCKLWLRIQSQNMANVMNVYQTIFTLLIILVYKYDNFFLENIQLLIA